MRKALIDLGCLALFLAMVAAMFLAIGLMPAPIP